MASTHCKQYSLHRYHSYFLKNYVSIFDNKCAGTNRRNGTHSVPGWNEHVNELHNIARQSFLEWIVEGKSKHGTVFDETLSG